MRGKLKVRKDKWHYRWWAFTYALSSNGAPDRTGRCSYVQRMIWLTLPIALVWAFVFVVVGFILAAMVLWKLFTGEGYTTPRQIHWVFTSGERHSTDRLFFRTDGFPIGRFRFYPYRFILPALAIWGLVWGFARYPGFTIGLLVGIGKGLLILAVLAAVFWVFSKSRRTEFYQLIAGYLRDKKERVCPLIVFEDPPPPDEPGPIKDLRESGFKFGDASDGDPEDRSVI